MASLEKLITIIFLRLLFKDILPIYRILIHLIFANRTNLSYIIINDFNNSDIL